MDIAYIYIYIYDVVQIQLSNVFKFKRSAASSEEPPAMLRGD